MKSFKQFNENKVVVQEVLAKTTPVKAPSDSDLNLNAIQSFSKIQTTLNIYDFIWQFIILSYLYNLVFETKFQYNKVFQLQYDILINFKYVFTILIILCSVK